MSKVLLSALLLLSVLGANAQSDASGGFGIPAGGTKTDVSPTFFIGPGEYQIDGTWQIFSGYVSVSSDAHIYGAGTLEFHNPAYAGGTTYVDGNNAQIDVNVSMGNTQGLTLADIASPAYTSGDSANNATFRVSRQLRLDSGYVYLNGTVNGAIPSLGNAVINDANVVNNLIIDSVGSSGSIAGYDGSHYVVTGNSARSHVIARFIAPEAFTFPVGRSDVNDYTPATITPAAADNLYVSVTDYSAAVGDYGLGINKPKGMDRAWNIYADAAIAPTITLQHNSPVTDGTGYTDASAFITQYLGSGWSGYNSAADNKTVSTGVTTEVQVFTLPTSSSDATAWLSKASNATSLPVSILSFQAFKQGGAALLQWTTASEINCKGYEIQRSTDAQNWSGIGFVNSLALNGNSSASLGYSYMDNNPAMGVNYYRLKQVSYSGEITYSRIRNLDFGVNASIYPNPASSLLNVTVTADSRYQMVDIIGRTLLTGNLQTGKNVLNVSSLPAGNYILRIIANNSASAYKIIIKR